MVKRYIAERYLNVKVPPLSKTDEMSKRYDDVIDLSVGDPDYPVDKGIIKAMYDAGMEGHTKYTDYLGDPEFRQSISGWYKEDYGAEYNKENIMVTAGGTHAMYLVMESLLNEGDEVIVVSPYYTFYEPQIQLPRGKVIVYDTLPEDDFQINLENLEKVITNKTKAIIVNTPNNPTGKVYKEKTMNGLIDLADKHDFIIIADDIYCAFNYTEDNKPFCALDPKNPRIITIYSFSKDFVMTGFRLGFIIAHKDLIDTFNTVNGAVNFTINGMTQKAGIYAINNRKRIQKEISEEYKKRVLYAYERVQKLNNISCGYPDGTFYLYPDIRETGLNSYEIWEKILDEAHVLILPGNGFGDAGEGFIRIACTSNIETIGEAFDRLEKMDIFK